MAEVLCGGSGGSGGGCGGGRSGVFDFCQALFDVGKRFLFAFAEAFEFLGYALLDLEFEGFGARGVGL